MSGPPLSEEEERKRADYLNYGLDGSREKEEQRAKAAKDAEESAKREKDLEPMKKALRDEVDFLGKKYNYTSKIGGRGLF